MNHHQSIAMLPLLITAYGSVLLMSITAFSKRSIAAYIFTLVILSASAISVIVSYKNAPMQISDLIIMDSFSYYFIAIITIAGLLITMLSRDYLSSRSESQGAFYILLSLAVLGAQVITASSHLVALFLGIEILSVSLYAMIGYTKEIRISLEAAVKYLVLAAASSAVMLFGIAMIYSESGSMVVSVISKHQPTVITYFGLSLLLVGLGFKLAVFPFHMWSPDVYQGAPAPVSAFIATLSKGAVFAFLVRFPILNMNASSESLIQILTIISIATMFAGNLLALNQTNIKRMLAYSSIAHIGYLLIPLIAGTSAGISSIAFYLVSYFVTVIAAFGVIALMSHSNPAKDFENISDYKGLWIQKPWLAAIMSLSMLSLTGIPLTSGFIAKFYLFASAVDSGLWLLVILGILNSGISAYYYIRVVINVYLKPEKESVYYSSSIPVSSIVALVIVAVIILVLGIYPEPFFVVFR